MRSRPLARSQATPHQFRNRAPIGNGIEPLEGFVPATDLECLLGRYSPEHTSLLFSYTT